MSDFFWQSISAVTSRIPALRTDTEQIGRTVTPLQAEATVATLLESVDITRLITTRDRISIGSPVANLAIPPETACREYLRFLTIKILAVDTPASNLSPSWYIDQLWHSHILDTEAYTQVRAKWPGRLEHDPVPPGGRQGQKERLSQTLKKYQEFFQQNPLRDETIAIWSDPSNQGQHEDGGSLKESGTHSAPAPQYSRSPSYPISIKSLPDRPVVTLLVSSQMKLPELKVRYQELSGWPIDKQHFSFKDDILSGGKSLGEYGVGREATLQHHPEFPFMLVRIC